MSSLYLKVKNKFSPTTLAVLAGGLVLIGLVVVMFTRAAGTKLYLAPATVTIAPNGTFQVAVRVDTPEQINTVQAIVNYPAAQLELTAVDYTGTAFPLQAEETKSTGSVRIGRGTNAGQPAVTGNLLVATLTFKALTAGTANITFGSGSMVLKADGLGTNVLGSTEPAVVTITAPTTATASMSVLPAAANVAQGSTISLQIWEDSGTATVNAVQANITYPATQLELVSISYVGTAFPLQAQELKTTGSIKIGRGLNGGDAPISGNKLIATLNFKGLTTSGSAAVGLAADSAVVSSTTNQNILTTRNGGTYTMTTAPDTTLPTVSFTAPANGATVSGSVNVAVTANDNVGVTRVELWVDGALFGTDTTAPYAFTWPATTAGSHALLAKAFDAAGNQATATITVTVPDTTAPAAPGNLRTTSVGSTSVALAWNAATDNIGVTGYQVLRNNVVVASPITLAYTDTGLTPSTAYSYTVKARDAAGNFSAASTPLAVTTTNKAGDVDGNGRVDIFDLSRVLTRWRTSDPAADFDKNGLVDAADLNLVLANWEG